MATNDAKLLLLRHIMLGVLSIQNPHMFIVLFSILEHGYFSSRFTDYFDVGNKYLRISTGSRSTQSLIEYSSDTA